MTISQLDDRKIGVRVPAGVEMFLVSATFSQILEPAQRFILEYQAVPRAPFPGGKAAEA